MSSWTFLWTQQDVVPQKGGYGVGTEAKARVHSLQLRPFVSTDVTSSARALLSCAVLGRSTPCFISYLPCRKETLISGFLLPRPKHGQRAGEVS